MFILPAARGGAADNALSRRRFAAHRRRLVLAACQLGFLSGCISAKPDPKHLAEIDALGNQRLGSPLQVQSLFKVDPRHQADPPTGVLTLQLAVNLALQHNLSLVAAATNLPIAQAQLAQAALMQNPTLGQTGNFAIPIDPAQGAVAFDVLLTQQINTFITQGARVDAAKAQRFQAGIDLVTQSFQLAQQVDSKYQELVNDARSRRVQMEDAQAYQRAYEEAQAQAKVGLATPSDVNRARLQFEDAQRQVRHFELQSDRAMRELNWLMGFASAPAWRMPEDADTTPDDLPAPPDAPLLEELAGKNRLDLLRADFDRQVAAADLKLARRNLIPETTLGVDYAQDSSYNKFLGPQLGSVVLPIFDPGIVAVQAAKYQAQKADKTYVALEGQLRQDVRSAHQNLKVAAEDVVFYREKFIPQQKENIRIAEENFRRGFGGFDSYLGALHDYAAAQTAYLAALQTYHDNGQALETAVGVRWPQLLKAAAPAGQASTAPATAPTSRSDAASRQVAEAAGKAAEASKKAAEAAKAAAEAAQAASRAAESLKLEPEKP